MKTFLSVSLTLLLVSRLSGWAADKNTYTNPAMGVTITKPANWVFITKAQQAENLKGIKLKDEQFQELVQKYAAAALAVMAKYRELPDDVNPSLKVDVRPFDNSSGDDPAAFLKQMETPLSEGFEDFQMVVSPKETTIAGCKAAYMKIYYSYPIAGGPRVPTCSEIWAIPRKHFFVLLAAATRQDEKTGTREEIQKILSSLKLE